jgi:hypothetical protein
MSKLQFTALATALALSLSGGAFGMTRAEYKAGKDEVSAKYKSDKAACKSMTGNAKDVCIEEAKGREKVAKAELEQTYKPSDRHANDVRMTKAKADYNVAKEKCDDKTGNDKDVCKKEAKAAYVAAKGNAKVDKKVADASSTAGEKKEAKKDAAADKRDADYAAAKEKCDALKGDAKDNCVKQAKAKFGQS